MLFMSSIIHEIVLQKHRIQHTAEEELLSQNVGSVFLQINNSWMWCRHVIIHTSAEIYSLHSNY